MTSAGRSGVLYGRRWLIQATLAAGAVVVGGAAPWPTHEARAQGKAGAVGAWQPTGLAEPVRQLYTPASGAFFARTREALWRSDDAGATWASVSLPPLGSGERQAAVDPTNHTVLYASGAEGLYKTNDDAATWASVLPGNVQAVVVSPADPRIVYAITLRGSLVFHRSRDGGATWDEFPIEIGASPCVSSVILLQAHPTDPQRVFRTAGCYAGRNFGDGLWESHDQGTTWAQTFRVQGTFPRRLAGGAGSAPQRFYLAAGGAVPGAPAQLARADDDGQTWRALTSLPLAANAAIGGLVSDPALPDRVWTAIGGRGVLRTDDGGATWAELGAPGPGAVNDLALGIDARNLYAATEQGVWRLPLDG
jgi:photosystem II stability/assembly factor-like uncharacterized protein